MLRTEPTRMVRNERVWTAQGDAWQAEGRRRAALGGGAAELPGVRVMASGLPHAQWNSGDVSDPTRVDVGAVRDWYASRAHGRGVPWGVRVPAGMPFAHGRFLFRKRCMALAAEAFRPTPEPEGLAITLATPRDLDTVARIDAATFAFEVAATKSWIAPRLEGHGFEVALASLGGQAVGAATSIRTDERAGRCVGIFAVGVEVPARRHGIASALTSWLLTRAFVDGADLAHLNPDNDGAVALYARLGFVETAGLDVFVDLVS